jgi:TetR/AcrR family transcriptional repressor of mexAB-oprM operon
VPRNRQEVDRNEKVDDILRVGAHILRSEGYAGLSVQSVAAELGVARGAIYWYFRSKDELFAASAGRAIADALRHPPHTRTASSRIEWAVERLADLQPIHTALQERARYSLAVAALLAEIQEGLLGQLRNALRPHVVAARLDPVASVIFIHVQGTLSMQMAPRDRRRHLRFLLDELLGAPP